MDEDEDEALFVRFPREGEQEDREDVETFGPMPPMKPGDVTITAPQCVGHRYDRRPDEMIKYGTRVRFTGSPEVPFVVFVGDERWVVDTSSMPDEWVFFAYRIPPAGPVEARYWPDGSDYPIDLSVTQEASS